MIWVLCLAENFLGVPPVWLPPWSIGASVGCGDLPCGSTRLPVAVLPAEFRVQIVGGAAGVALLRLLIRSYFNTPTAIFIIVTGFQLKQKVLLKERASFRYPTFPNGVRVYMIDSTPFVNVVFFAYPG